MALGLRVRRGCSFHGLAFNVAMDLSPYQRINPCGYRGLAVTQLVELGGPALPSLVAPVLVRELSRQLGLVPVTAPAVP
jgi:lipoyl(octanoyl) transferase